MRSLLMGMLLLSNNAFAQAQGAASPGVTAEALRPLVHYTPRRNWMNDPNGPVYFEGEYHLFYQYDPYAPVMGHISWGHAVSKDLLHWQELGVAIAESDGQMIFTGSVVVDEKNTSGLCRAGKPCMISIYTAHSGDGAKQLETQDLAVSQDRGRTWTKYSGNPVLNLHMANFRDPNVTWNEETGSWLMTVALPDEHRVLFYTSPDLKRWTGLTHFGPANGAAGGQWECPSLLHIPSADRKESIWALKVGINPGSLQGGSGEQYFLGNFDGKSFTQSALPGSHGWTDYGKDSYCAVPYKHLPPGSKPTLIAWMDNWQYADKLPTAPWRGQMTLPREVTLIHDAAGLALSQQPIVRMLREGEGEILTLRTGTQNESIPVSVASPVELELHFDPAQGGSFGVRLYSDAQHWTEVGFDKARHSVYVDRVHSGEMIGAEFPARTNAPLVATRPFDIHLVLDRISLEVFAQGGTIAMTNLLFPPQASVQIRAFGEAEAADVTVTGHVWRLRPSAPAAAGDPNAGR